MTDTLLLRHRHRAALHPVRHSWQTRQHLIGAAITAFALTVVFVVAPPAPATAAEIMAAYNAEYGQTFQASGAVAPTVIARDSYSVTPGVPSLAASGTNYDWAKAVLTLGGWPVSEANVTVFVRWMRQENGPDNWWNRNNPLNNGWGSGGGGGTGSYPNLIVAAENAAEALHGGPGYRALSAACALRAPTEVTEHAIWASPWASGHYANGAHWHYTPVPIVKAPAGAWQ
jgi:hypothetical protein